MAGILAGGPQLRLPGPTTTGTPIYPGAPTAKTTTAPKVAAQTSSGPSAAELAAQQAAAAEAKATANANTSARSSASQQKSSLQQSIDANDAQIGANNAKLDALRRLITEGLVASRDTNLGNIDQALQTLLGQTKSHYDTQLGDLNQSLRTNEKAEADSSFQNLANRAREKQDLVTQALSQGAGESDVLKTQLQALRNWDANQGEVNRAYFDTLDSVNGSINDLNTGTQTAMTNAELDANAKKSSVWGDFYGSVSDSYTQMDNLATNNYLLQGENAAARANMGTQDALVSWLDSGKNAADWVAPTVQASTRAPLGFDGYADEAADWAGKSWATPGVSDATKNWQGQATQKGSLASSQVWDQQTNSADKGQAAKKRPEGATLRRW